MSYDFWNDKDFGEFLDHINSDEHKEDELELQRYEAGVEAKMKGETMCQPVSTYEPTHPYDSPYMTGPRAMFVGWYTLTETTEHVNHGQTACNYEFVEVSPGSYPVFAFAWASAITGLTRFHVLLEGIVTSDFYQNRLFHATSNHTDENVGKSRTTSFEFYRYDMDKHTGFAPKQED